MKLERKYLKQLKKNKEFVDIYTDNYDESNFGFIVDFNDTFLVLDSYNEDAKADGIVVFFRENITRIRWKGNEITSLSNIANSSKNRNKAHKIDLSSVQSVIDSIQKYFGYINVSIQNIDSGVCFIGEVEEMDENTIVINEYGTRISLDRKNILLSIHDITKIEAGGIYEAGLLKVLKK